MDRLIRMGSGRRRPHAFLLTGNQGTGRRAAALLLARILNCCGDASPELRAARDDGANRRNDREPGHSEPDHHVSFYDEQENCSCSPCRKIMAGQHPDIISLPDEAAAPGPIRIQSIRDLIEIVTRRPHEGRCRVLLLPDAQRMTAGASNALLKLLEEPPEGTILILTAPRPADLLITIQSRCQTIRFAPPSLADLTNLIRRRHALPVNTARALASVASGREDRIRSREGMRLLHDRLRLRERLLRGLDLLFSGRAAPFPTALMLAEHFSPEKELAQDALDLLLSLLRDMAVLSRIAGSRADHGTDHISDDTGNGELLLNPDRRQALAELARSCDEQRVLSLAEAARSAAAHIRANGAVRTVLESFWLNAASPQPAGVSQKPSSPAAHLGG